MAVKTAAELVVDVVTDATKATAGMDDLERSVKGAGDTAERTSRQIGISADAADELGGKAGKATGALGALSSGFELVGAEKYAVGLQAAGMATDFFSGVGDSLNLVMESTILKTARARVVAIAHSVATGASAAATGVMTAAQWALNAALNANPVALITIALIALVAGLVLAYKKSDAVRNIINAVGRAGRAAIGSVVDVVRNVVSWIGERLPAAGRLASGLVVGYFRAMLAGPALLVTAASSAVTWVRDKIPDAFNTAKGVAQRVGDALAAPFKVVVDIINNILTLISKIKLPKLPDLNPFSRTTGGSTSAGAGVVNQYDIDITVQGAVDPYSTAQQIIQLLSRYGVTFNLVTVP